MPTIYEAFPSKNLAAADLEDGVDTLVTIESYEFQEFKGPKGTERKPVFTFAEFEKPFVCNKTNGTTIARALGADDFDDWIGRQITIYATETEFGGKMTPCIRVRTKAPKKAPAGKMPGGAVEGGQKPQRPVQPAQPAQQVAGGGRARNQPVTQAEADQDPDQDQDDDIPFVRPAYPYPQM